MISNTSAWPGSGVTGQGSDFSAPPAYITASRMELAADGGRSMERKDEQDGARVRVEGREERELVNGAGTRRGLSGKPEG